MSISKSDTEATNRREYWGPLSELSAQDRNSPHKKCLLLCWETAWSPLRNLLVPMRSTSRLWLDLPGRSAGF
jgi:hypothetical protein